MMGTRRYIQGYNAQAVVNEQQIVIAAEVTGEAGDFSHLRPMVSAALRELEDACVTDKPEVAVADAGYWNEQHMDDVVAEHGVRVLVPPDATKREGERPGWTGGHYAFMRRVLATELGDQLYRKRKVSSSRCSVTRSTTASSTAFSDEAGGRCGPSGGEMLMSHNLTKLHRHQLATAGP